MGTVHRFNLASIFSSNRVGLIEVRINFVHILKLMPWTVFAIGFPNWWVSLLPGSSRDGRDFGGVVSRITFHFPSRRNPPWLERDGYWERLVLSPASSSFHFCPREKVLERACEVHGVMWHGPGSRLSFFLCLGSFQGLHTEASSGRGRSPPSGFLLGVTDVKMVSHVSGMAVVFRTCTIGPTLSKDGLSSLKGAGWWELRRFLRIIHGQLPETPYSSETGIFMLVFTWVLILSFSN